MSSIWPPCSFASTYCGKFMHLICTKDFHNGHFKHYRHLRGGELRDKAAMLAHEKTTDLPPTYSFGSSDTKTAILQENVSQSREKHATRASFTPTGRERL